jgi:multiple sugar transport system ATP-binding protein
MLWMSTAGIERAGPGKGEELMAEIRLEGVTKKFGNVTAVNRIDLTARDKEFIALVGPSGCGKTTTLRMIAGLEALTEGKIYIGDRNVSEMSPRDRDIAMVFQNYALYPHMNVYKNMSFGLSLRKFSKKDIETRIMDAAGILEIEQLLHRKPKELSGGQRQRVAIGRAIVRKPQAFLFDEPLSNLDAKLRVQMRGELAKLHEKLQTTTVYVTHDQVEAMTLAHRIVIMEQGDIMQAGPPLEVYNNPDNLFVAGFIGSPSMNFFDAAVGEKDGTLSVYGEGFSFSVPDERKDRYGKAVGRPVILGIRPEHIFDKEIKGNFPGGEDLPVVIDVYEPMGSQVILRALCGQRQVLATVDPTTRARVHDKIVFIVNTHRMHIFDKETKLVY